MPLLVPDPDLPIDPGELIEQLGAELAARYAAAEDTLIEAIARRSWRDIALQTALAELTLTAEETKALVDRIAQNRAYAELQAFRAVAIRELQFLAVEVADKLRRSGLAQQMMDIAATEGEASAAAFLRQAKRIPGPSTLTGTSSQAVAALTIDLYSRLDAMNWRITRYPQDAYQRIISFTASNNLLGTVSGRVAQQQAVQRFLGEGIRGFTDVSGRQWRIGTYAEMAGRTAVRRAFEDAAVWRMQQSGVNLITLVGGPDACKRCAPWLGKILSTDGTTGVVVLPHATHDEQVTVVIFGTLDQAKAAGWGHPNCRDHPVGYLPGLSVPQAGFKHSPELEAERTKQREIEREIRAAKRRQSIAPDDISRRKAAREIAEGQAEMRQFIRRTGRPRSNYREQLRFADG